jgi:hypothetical protein
MDFIQKYFNAERAESLVFLGIGIIAMAIGAWFLATKTDNLLRGVAYPFIIIALIQIGVGAGIFLRSPKDIARVTQIVQNEPTKIQSEEIPRMEKVMQSFVTIRYVEIALLLIGLVLAFTMSNNPLWRGVGIGLAIQSLLMLGADYFAEARGHVYLAELKK